MDRRQLLKWGAASALACAVPAGGSLAHGRGAALPLRLSLVDVELAPGRIVRAVASNGRTCGPAMRLRMGRTVDVAVHNETGHDQTLRWHGAHSLGSSAIPAHGRRTLTLLPREAGIRGGGRIGYVFVEPSTSTSTSTSEFDQEHFLAVTHWEDFTCFNDRLFPFGPAIRVRQRQRVLFRFFNAGGHRPVTLALPHHRFTVIGLDGNRVLLRESVAELQIGPAERIDAVVEMSAPGSWVLGPTNRSDRQRGLGCAIVYAGCRGPPQWGPLHAAPWDYTRFGDRNAAAVPAATLPITFTPAACASEGMRARSLDLAAGRRHRLAFTNFSRHAHAVHLDGHAFELVAVAGQRTSGVVKDVITLASYSTTDVDVQARSAAAFLVYDGSHDAKFLPPSA